MKYWQERKLWVTIQLVLIIIYSYLILMYSKEAKSNTNINFSIYCSSLQIEAHINAQ